MAGLQVEILIVAHPRFYLVWCFCLKHKGARAITQPSSRITIYNLQPWAQGLREKPNNGGCENNLSGAQLFNTKMKQKPTSQSELLFDFLI